MKFKKMMLVTFLLLAILTAGAVSASDDADNLTATETLDSIESGTDDVDIIASDGEEPDVDIASSIYYEDEGEPIVQYFFPDDATGSISIFINGSADAAYSSEVITGEWVDIYGSDLKGFGFVPGSYGFEVVYPGNGNYGKYTWDSTLVITDEKDEPISADYNITFGEDHYFNQEVVKGRTYDASFEFPLTAEGNVTVYVDDKYYGVEDVDFGDVFIEINTANLTLGKHDVRFVYSGDDFFNSSTAYDSFNVTHIRFEVPYVLMPGAMGVSAYAALTVLPNDATGEVKLIVDDVEKASEAIDEGSVIYYLPNYLTYGNHTVTLAYQNGNYPSASKKFSVENLIKNDATVSFNPVDGEGEMANVTVVKNTNFTLPECGFTKQNRVFYGWNVDDSLRQPGENITVIGDISIITVWRYYEEIEPGSGGKATIHDMSVDASVTYIEGALILIDAGTGDVFTKNITAGPVQSSLTNYSYNNLTEDMINAIVNQLLSIAQTQAGNKAVSVKNQAVSNATVVSRFDNRTYTWLSYYEGIEKIDGSNVRLLAIGGSYGTIWNCSVLLEAEYGNKLLNIADVKVELSKTSFTYNAKVQKPTVTLTDGAVLTEGVDYTLKWSADSPKNAATYSVTVTGIGAYDGAVNATFSINKAANPLAVKAKTAKIKFANVKKKAQTLAVSKVVTFTKKGQGTLTYAKASGNKKITINKKTGKVTVAKGLKKGTYKVKVKIKAAGNANYKASAYKTVTFKIIIQ